MVTECIVVFSGDQLYKYRVTVHAYMADCPRRFNYAITMKYSLSMAEFLLN